jgi:co-chaperonin GroES (HSP10)
MEKNKVNFKPFNQNLLIYAPKIKETTDAGIIKSDSMIKEEKDKQDWFLEVAAVADDITDIKVGDKIFISSGKLPTIEIDNVQYVYVHKLSVVGKKL